MTTQSLNTRPATVTGSPKDSSLNLVLETAQAVAIVDFFGTAVIQQQQRISADIRRIMKSLTIAQGEARETSRPQLEKMIVEINALFYQARESGANQGGSIAMAVWANDDATPTEKGSNASDQSIKVFCVAFGDCRIWQLQKGTQTLLDTPRAVSYLGSYRLSQAVYIKELALQPEEHLLLTTGKFKQEQLTTVAARTDKRLLKKLGAGGYPDAVALVAHGGRKGGMNTVLQPQTRTIIKDSPSDRGPAWFILGAIVVVVVAVFLIFCSSSNPPATQPTVQPNSALTAQAGNSIQLTSFASLTMEVATAIPTEPIEGGSTAAPTATLMPTLPPTQTPTPAPATPTVPPEATSPENTGGASNSAGGSPSGLSVSLLEPANGANGSGDQTFRWQPNFTLADDQYFEVVFWKDGQSALDDGRGIYEPVKDIPGTLKEIDIVVDLTALFQQPNFTPGTYQWGILLVTKDPYQRVDFLGGGNRLNYEVSTQPEPTSTNTPKPTATDAPRPTATDSPDPDRAGTGNSNGSDRP